MEIDTTLVFGAIGAVSIVAGAVMAYGELKTKVVGLIQRVDSAQKAREKIFDRMNKLDNETGVQGVQIQELKGSNDKLFVLHEKQVEINQKLATSMETLTRDVHYIRDYVKSQASK